MASPLNIMSIDENNHDNQKVFAHVEQPGISNTLFKVLDLKFVEQKNK